MEKLRLRIKVCDYEIEAEGPQAFIHEQSEAFRKLLAEMTQQSVVPQLRDKADTVSSPKSQSPPLLSDQKVLPPNSPAAVLQKVLAWNNHAKHITCAVLPDGPLRTADTVLLLLLGYRELRGLNEISALALNKGLKAAGFNEFRLDRIMAPYLKDLLVIRSGVGKGGRYRLTTRGIEKALELVRTLAELIPDPLP